jgi:uroporphyrinogen decarboxylase
VYAMTSRARVLAALRHQEGDRVPVDLGGMRSTGIMALAYRRLRDHLGLPGTLPRVYDVGQQLAEPEMDVLERFGCDVIDLENSLGRWGEWQRWTLPDGGPCELPADVQLERVDGDWFLVQDGVRAARMPAGGFYFDQVYWPLAEARSVADLERYAWLHHSDARLRALQERAAWLYHNTDFAIMGGFGGNIVEMGQALLGWERFMMEMAYGGAFIEAFLDWMADNWIADLERYLEVVGPYIHIIQMGDDLGSQAGPLLSPEMYRALIWPRHKRIYDVVHAKSDLYLFLHSCGAIAPLIPDLIEAGVDILNPVQISAAGMDPAMLKRQYGDRLVFWGGGCDTQRVLPYAQPEEVRAHVRERVEIFAPGGGFVFCQVHNIQAGVPPENVVAMYEGVQSAGWLQRDYDLRFGSR